MTFSVPKEPTVYLPGISYLLEFDEVEIDGGIVHKVEKEFLDFLRTLTDILKLVSVLRRRHLRDGQPLPHAVIREIMIQNTMGQKFKEWDRQCRQSPGISATATKLFKSVSEAAYKAAMPGTKSAHERSKRNDCLLTKQKIGMMQELKEVIGKKKQPLWHTVAIDSEKDMSHQIKLSNVSHFIAMDENQDIMTSFKNRHRPIHRSASQELLSRIKLLKEKTVPPSHGKFKNQIDMLLASEAGFTSVEEYKVYVETKRPQWFKDLLFDTKKMGILYSEEIVTAFENLGQYYEISKRSIDFGKAKMCYLVMSLPVYDVCRAAFQMATNFFLHDILGEPPEEEILQRWLKHRLLPYVVYPPIIAAEYAFNIGVKLEQRLSEPFPPDDSARRQSSEEENNNDEDNDTS